jgi:phosphogluconate dehydratase
LLDAGLLHEDVTTVAGGGLSAYTQEPWLDDGRLAWRAGPAEPLNQDIVRPYSEPFSLDGGLKLLKGNVGRAVIKVSAVKPPHRIIEAPAIVFQEQDDVLAAFDRGELERDFVAVVTWQGPAANGMPELHKLTPTLSILQERGFQVALVTDGRMSGASGKVPAAIHVTPEALSGGAIGRIQTGDIVRLDAEAGTLDVLGPVDWLQRAPFDHDLSAHVNGIGRDLFGNLRKTVSAAERGACTLFETDEAVNPEGTAEEDD